MGASMKSCTKRFGVPGLLSILAAILIFASAPASAATIVALGASNTYGKGRVYNNALGHDVEAMNDPSFHAWMRRGVLWAATGQAE